MTIPLEAETGEGEPDDAADTEEDNIRLTKSASDFGDSDLRPRGQGIHLRFT